MFRALFCFSTQPNYISSMVCHSVFNTTQFLPAAELTGQRYMSANYYGPEHIESILM